MLVGRSDDRVHAVLVDVDVWDVWPPDLVQREQTVAVGLHRLDEAVGCDKDRPREVDKLKLLQLPRPAPMTRQVLSTYREGYIRYHGPPQDICCQQHKLMVPLRAFFY